MMLTKILTLLKSNTELPVRFIKNDKVEKCIIYNFTPISDDGVIRQDKLQIQIVGFDIKEIEEEDLKIRKNLLSFGDRIDDILKIELNGGGVIDYDDETSSLSKFSFYIITNRSEVSL